MLLFFLPSAFSYDFNCTAPLSHASPPPGGSLLSFALFLRDGLGTPASLWLPKNASGYWICDSDTAPAPRVHLANYSGALRRYATPYDPALVDYPPTCGVSDLTVQGMRSQTELGSFYRDFLVNEMKFLPSDISPSILNLRSSYPDNAFRSAESFLNSFYPPAHPGEFLEITTGSAYADPLYIDYDGICGDITAAWKSFTGSALFEERKEQAKTVYKALFEKLNKTIDDTNWMKVGDWATSAFCGGQPLPGEVTDEVFAQAIADLALFSWGPLNQTRGVGASAILRQLFSAFDESLAGRSPEKFFLFSGHEATLVALLSTIGVRRQSVSPFMSHLAVEVWAVGGVQKVRFVLNGDPVGIDLFGGESLVEYKQLKDALDPYLHYCTAFD
jgi:acid phosphatase